MTQIREDLICGPLVPGIKIVITSIVWSDPFVIAPLKWVQQSRNIDIICGRPGMKKEKFEFSDWINLHFSRYPSTGPRNCWKGNWPFMLILQSWHNYSLLFVLCLIHLVLKLRGLCFHAFFLRRDKTRLEATSQSGGTGTRLLFSGPDARENPGKIWDGTGLLSTTRESL